MTDTAYIMISTTDLINAWIEYGLFSSLIVYNETPEEVKSIVAPGKGDVTITTTKDTYVIPRSDRKIKMWRILA